MSNTSDDHRSDRDAAPDAKGGTDDGAKAEASAEATPGTAGTETTSDARAAASGDAERKAESAAATASDSASDSASDAAPESAGGSGAAGSGDDRSRGGLSRRSLFTSVAVTAGVAGTAGAFGAAQAISSSRPDDASAKDPRAASEAFYGEHQPGIATPQQGYAMFAAFDLATTDMRSGEEFSAERRADNFRELMEKWTQVAERLMRGAAPGTAHPDRPGLQDSSGAADGLPPARLTLTFGLGPDLFSQIGREDRKPRRLRELPSFSTDRLNKAWSGGQLFVQICAEDLQVVSDAFRAVRSRTPGLARLLWSQQGFLGLPPDGGTPRNLFGHKDGTANPEPGTEEFAAAVWAAADEPSWFTAGTYVVFRKIRMHLPRWDLAPRTEQDLSIGRRRDNGAPLSGGEEFTEPDLTARGPDGKPAIPPDSHVALVKDIPMFRRGYNYDYGFQGITEPVGAPSGGGSHGGGGGHSHGGDDHGGDDHGHAAGERDHGGGGHDVFDSGLLFCAYMRDPEAFVRAQKKLAGADRLNKFIEHTGSAIFAVPPGARPGQAIAAGLF